MLIVLISFTVIYTFRIRRNRAESLVGIGVEPDSGKLGIVLSPSVDGSSLSAVSLVQMEAAFLQFT